MPTSFMEAAAQALAQPSGKIYPKFKFTHVKSKPPKKKKPTPPQAEFDFWTASYKPHDAHDVYVGRSPDKDRTPIAGKDFAEHHRTIYTAPVNSEEWDWYYLGGFLKMHVPTPELGLGW